MPYYWSGQIGWIGNYGGKQKERSGKHYATARTFVENCPSWALIYDFHEFLMTYTDCTRLSESLHGVRPIYNTPPVSGTVSVRKRAIIFARRPDGQVIKMTLPGVKNAYIEVNSEGKRLTKAALNAIVTAWSTASALSLTPLYSKVIDE
jgi:hypothetical protein